jgi:hypothetical protein
MDPTDQSSSGGQTNETDKILQTLNGFETNVGQLVKHLESNNEFGIDGVLMVMTNSDYGARLFLPVAKLSDPDCLARLIDPLRTIEQNLKRASKFTGRSASPTLQMFVPSKLQLVRSILADVQTRSGRMQQKEEKKKWWQPWK